MTTAASICRITTVDPRIATATVFSVLTLLVLQVGAAPAATIDVAGISFDANAFVDVVLSDSGTITSDDYHGAVSLEAAITGSDLNSYFDPDSTDWVEVGFVDNVMFNGAGNDLAVFETLSATDAVSMRLSLGGAAVVVPVTHSGLTSSGGYQINIGYLNLDDFGVPPNGSVDHLFVFGTDLPEVTALGALNSRDVPEPATLAIAVVGLLGAGVSRRKRT